MSIQHDEFLGPMLSTLRGTLHACAEPAGSESLTASVVESFLQAYKPDELLTNLGGHGVAAIYEGRWEGPTVVVRSELDALRVEERRADQATGVEGTFVNTAHRCGHDGHMTMVAGLAPRLHQQPPMRGRVVLLFQPAEETGEGALRIVSDPKFLALEPDYAIALHNLPGYPQDTVVYRRGTFASASVGMKVELKGLAAHAAEPELAVTPSAALYRLLESLPSLTELETAPYRLITITHVRMGRRSFGITPGRATLYATLRSASGIGLDELCARAEELVTRAAQHHGLAVDLDWVEAFPETRNDDELVATLERCCAEEGIETTDRELPFRWSEDFGHYAKLCPTLYFGLGIGEEAPGLHQPDYVFPDEVMDVGGRTLWSLVRQLTSPMRRSNVI